MKPTIASLVDDVVSDYEAEYGSLPVGVNRMTLEVQARKIARHFGESGEEVDLHTTGITIYQKLTAFLNAFIQS